MKKKKLKQNAIKWGQQKFTDVLAIKGGGQPPKKYFIHEPKEGYVRLLQIRDFGKRPVPTFVPDTTKLQKCTEDDILIARYGASIGRILTGMSGAYNVAMAKVIIPEFFNKRFVRYLLMSPVFQVPIVQIQRTAQSGFNKKDLAQINIPVPPLDEQIVLVRKLEKLFTQQRGLKTSLTRLPALLVDFREAVLNKAVEKVLSYNRDSKPLKELCTRVTVGFVGKMSDKYQTTGIPFLRSQNVRTFRYSEKGLMFIAPEFEEEIKKSRLFPRDVLIVRSGHPGTTCVLPDDFPGGNCSDILIATTKEEILNPHFLAVYLNSPLIQRHISGEKVGIAQAHFNTKSLQRVKIPLLSLKEQQHVVDEVHALYKIADRIEAKLATLTTQVGDLPQAILGKAFRGEL